MSRAELIKQLESKQKKERPPTSPKHTRSSNAGAPLPPVPPPDYDQLQLKSPPPVPSRGHCPRSPRAARNHERSKTAPVNPIDVELAQKPNRNSSRSAKEPAGKTQGCRPYLNKHPSSDLTAYGRVQESFPVERRNSSEPGFSRSPAPTPLVDRPPAPVPKEPIKDNRSSRLGGFPTPMVLAMQERQADEPPPTPKRNQSAPKVQPRPAPRKSK
ncbi:protein enabled homolog isoform X6 [Actinia tenebrosa]|nr:protein enabled homolog isoform X6 [Actinia tenebrosa]